VAKTPEEKQEQRSFFFWYKPEMRGALRSTLHRLGMDQTAAKLLGGESAKFEMIGGSDPGFRRDERAGPRAAPRAAKPWFGGRTRR